MKGDKRNLRVEFERQTTNKEGENKLHGVKIIVDNREGRSYTVTGKEAFIGQQNSSFDVRGDVKLETSDGLTAHGQQATYVDAEKIVRVPGRGHVQARAHDRVRHRLHLRRAARHDVDPRQGRREVRRPRATPARWRSPSGAFGYARRDRYMRLEKTLHIDREGQLIDADRVDGAPVSRSRRAGLSRAARRLEDHRRPERQGAASRCPRRDINIDYADDGRTMQNATLAGNAAIELAPKQGAAGQKLAGNFMDIGLEPDGSVRSLSTRDNVTATLPATKDTAARTIRSTALTAAGNAQGLNRMIFSEGVEYREAATKTQGARIARAKSLEASLDPAAGALEEARFTGNFDFTDGPMRALSNDARYNVDRRHAGPVRQGDHARDQRRGADAAGREPSTSRSIRAR